MKLKRDRQGFTIMELVIASGVFSVILLIASAAIIKIGQIYYKGIIAGRTQEVSRSIMDEITRTLQFNGGEVSAPLTPTSGSSGTAYGFCIDNKRYSYIIDRQLADTITDPASQSKHVFVVDDDCASGVALNLDGSAGTGVNGRELMGDHMRLGTIPYPVSISPTLYNMSLEVVYGDEIVLSANKTAVAPPTTPATFNYACPANSSGGQFCSVSHLSTIIEKRVQ